ncbi:hypothetical protein OG218_00275 [Kineococcus sp. NBC_00420]|uniref:hypothetical protein n=1 Tax=Kineococcus sp. NBC_00420 TaxID=2903564 RepID=UPI002E1D612B
MAAPPITLSTTLDSTASVDEVLTRLRQLSWGPSVRWDQPTDTTLRISSGSRLRYRMLGKWAGGQHFPLSAVFHLEPHEHGTSVHFTLTNNEGWYLLQTPRGREACRARFDELLAAMSAEGIVEHR